MIKLELPSNDLSKLGFRRALQPVEPVLRDAEESGPSCPDLLLPLLGDASGSRFSLSLREHSLSPAGSFLDVISIFNLGEYPVSSAFGLGMIQGSHWMHETEHNSKLYITLSYPGIATYTIYKLDTVRD